MTKKLYILISNNGDGSYSPHYTFNTEWIEKQEARDEAADNEMADIGVDADGFHYDVLYVPDDTTLESLGRLPDCAEEED